MGVTEGQATGRYGEILEHSLIRGLFYMVICPAAVKRGTVGGINYIWPDVWAIVIADDSGMTVKVPVGQVTEIAAKGWIIHE